MYTSVNGFILLLWLCLAAPQSLWAQDLEPRRWTHLPVGSNYISAFAIDTSADVFLDPVLLIEDGEADFRTAGFSYLHAFDLAGKSARFDVRIPYQRARWSGLLDGEFRTVRRSGFADPRLRLSVNFLGAPALRGEAFRQYRTSRPVHTVAGAALSVTLPLGEYMEDRLLNIGQNRYTIRPQIGAVHIRGPWAFELTGSVFFHTDNDNFRGTRRREQDPLAAVQTHIIHTFRPGLWASLSAGYGWGGESTVDGAPRDDARSDFLSALSIGIPINRTTGIRFSYVRVRTNEDIGSDSDNFAIAISRSF